MRQNNLLNISEALSLALHACIFLSLPKNISKKVSAVKISIVLNISEHYLTKVFQRLSKAKLIVSSCGPKGGFSLRKSPKEITLMEIYEAVEGFFPIDNCLLTKKICKEDNCLFADLINKTNSIFKEYFENTTLNNLEHVYDKEDVT